MRDSFVIYKSMIEAISLLSPEEGIEMIKAMGAFSFEEIEPSFEKPNMKMCWLLIRPLLEKNNRNYRNGCNGGAPKGNRNNPNGRRGKPITNRELTENQSTPSNDVDDNVDDNVDGEGDVDEKRKTNHPPTLEELLRESTTDNYRNFIKWIESDAPYVYSHMELPDEKKFYRLKKQYKTEQIMNVILQIENRRDLRQRYSNLYRTILNWMKKEQV